jgi:hypothetical protein
MEMERPNNEMKLKNKKGPVLQRMWYDKELPALGCYKHQE